MRLMMLWMFSGGSALAADAWGNKTDTFGLGADGTLGGLQGLSVRYNLNRETGILATAGLASSSRNLSVGKNETNTNLTQGGFGLYGSYKFIRSKSVAMSAVAGMDLVFDGTSTDDGVHDPVENSSVDLRFGTGLMGEVWLARKFSLFSKVGLAIDPVSKAEFAAEIGDPEDDGNRNVDYSGMDVSLGGGLLAGAGFTVWFD